MYYTDEALANLAHNLAQYRDICRKLTRDALQTKIAANSSIRLSVYNM